MVEVTLSRRPVESVFELLGSRENDITKSIGWALANSPHFLKAFCERIDAPLSTFESIKMQESGSDGGYTDIELHGSSCLIVIEAKRGWWLPHEMQFQKYAGRFNERPIAFRKFIAMSDCTSDYAGLHLPQHVDGIPIQFVGWRDVIEIAGQVGGSNAEKRLLRELIRYLSNVTTMQPVDSNWVYVVSLGTDIPAGGTISWIDIVEKHNTYFHPVGNRWPKEPPNYIAFRYHGKLQSIHHIEGYRIVDDPAHAMPGLPDHWREDWQEHPHFVYKIGPAIRPAHEVRAGASVRRSARVWAMLDLLLTCETVTDAMCRSRER